MINTLAFTFACTFYILHFTLDYVENYGNGLRNETNHLYCMVRTILQTFTLYKFTCYLYSGETVFDCLPSATPWRNAYLLPPDKLHAL